jgi:hypothetical protein
MGANGPFPPGPGQGGGAGGAVATPPVQQDQGGGFGRMPPVGPGPGQGGQPNTGSLIPNNLASNFLNLGQVANQVGSASGLAVPGAAMFQQGLYNPGFNANEQAYLQNAGNLQENQIMRTFNNTLANRFEGNSGIAGQELQLGADTSRLAGQDLLQSALQLNQQRQGLAAANLPNVLTNPVTAAQDSAQAGNSMASLGSTLMNQPINSAESILNGSPFVPPSTIVPPAQVHGSSGKK